MINLNKHISTLFHLKPLCMACHKRAMVAQEATIMKERQSSIFVFEHVPALVCQNCGNISVELAISARLGQCMKHELASGPKKEFIEYTSVA